MNIGPYKFAPSLIPSLATVLLLWLFIWLGNWQLGRADFKQLERDKIIHNTKLPAISIKPEFKNIKNMLGRKTVTSGSFDTAHEAVVAFHKYRGQPGFLVLTPFLIDGTDTSVLVIRGWIAQSLSRGFTRLPFIPKSEKGKIELRGIVDRVPSVGRKSGKPDGQFANQWPKMLIYADVDWYRKKLNRKFMPYAVKQTYHNSAGLIADWKAFAVHRERMPPEKHLGYAFQWFSLAIVLLVLYFSLNAKRIQPDKERQEDK